MRVRGAIAALSAVACLLGTALQPVRAATPSQARLDAGHRSATWTGGPLTGAAPATRRIFCSAPTICDTVALAVDLPAAAFGNGIPVMQFELTTSAPNQMQILLYAPGSEPSPSNSHYTLFSDHAAVVTPKTGTWHVSAVCSQCVNASYTITAIASALPGVLPVAPSFTSTVLPGLTPSAPEGAGEPGIAIGPRDEIWVNGPGSAASFWGSYDGGRTYRLHQPDDSPSTADTWLTIGPDGTIYADNLSHAGGTNFVYVSRDHGATWTNRQVAGMNVPFIAGTDSDRQWFTADPKTPGTVYFESHDLAGADGNPVLVARSTDYGQTWTPTALVSLQEVLGGSSDSLGGNSTGPITFTPDGKTMVFQVETAPNAPDGLTASPNRPDFDVTKIYVFRSTDGGSTWKASLLADRTGKGYVHHGLQPIVADRSGNLYYVWSERPVDGVTTVLYLAHSSDQGKTWSAPVRVSDNGASNVFPAVAAGGDPGRVDVAWLESPARDFNDPGAVWTVVMAQTANALDGSPTFTKTQVSDGPVHTGDICQSGLYCEVTMGNRNLLDYIWMAVDSVGTAYVAYPADASGALQTIVSKQTAGSRTVGPPTPSPVTGPAPAVVKAATQQRRLPATGGPGPWGWGAAGLILSLAAAGMVRRRR